MKQKEHRIQSATRGLCTFDKIHYLKNEWLNLLIETLIREAKFNNDDVLKIPSKFLILIETDIINKINLMNKKRQLWIEFGRWLELKESIQRRNVREHLRLKWKKLKHAMAVVMQATNAINDYYFHTLKHPSHQSDNFWENFIEHFGAYTRNNLLPFTSSNTASTHNSEHEKCVNNLLCELIPLSDLFPMIAVNFNTISDYHWDEHDNPNCLCILIALSNFDGGELCFPQLKIIIPLRPNQIVAFSSRLLLHGNLPVKRGIHHSIVYFVHSSFFHNLRDFTKVYSDFENGIERNAKGKIILKPVARQNLKDARNFYQPIKLTKAKLKQIRIPSISTDCRRKYINLRKTCKGLKAEKEDLISDTE
ncbi:hypothetical protein Glove_468g9 [Diversispora epigaea]|uniref:Uncharacterized protein n=1 Tax=Diversispora epigaea TaxID=1348612 RepID=A0A397GLJ5_9GLOM|nr:hypothetical protein Glove_468g9 [Diversispora epigaea]